MPILHIHFSAQAKTPDGSAVDLPRAAALQGRGPVVQVTISLGKTLAGELLQQGKPLPTPVSGLALIDTGASSTCVDDETAKAMGLPVIDVVKMASASHDATDQCVYPVQIEFVGFPINIESPRTIGAALKVQGLLLLVCRDVLAHTMFVYNGLAGEITFCI